MDAVEKRILEIIDENTPRLQAIAEDIFTHAEKGFHEFRTAAIVAEFLKKLDIPVREGLAATGVKGTIDGGEGPNVALIGELDGLLCPYHPQATKEGFAHSCGHFAQITSILGAALALNDPEVRKALHGKVTIFAVPCEESIDDASREHAEKEYGVTHHGGKRELIARGEFDDIDVAVINHSHLLLRGEKRELMLGYSPSTCFIAKTVKMYGKASHAAAAPHEGVNALNAVTLALSAIGMLRETFQEKDFIRIHSVIRKGGDAVNIVPSYVEVALMVRASNLEAMEMAAGKVDNAFRGAAMAIGASCDIQSELGYLPMPKREPHPVLWEASKALSERGVKVENVPYLTQDASSTDVGDLSYVKAVLPFTFGGSEGALHSVDYKVTDPYLSNIMPAQMMALTAYTLLKDGAKGAQQVMKDYAPVMSKEEYLSYVEKKI